RLAERERIARDLHDTFLQSVHGLILKFDAATQQLPASEPARQAMEEALDRADYVIAEGRDRVKNLRNTSVLQADLPAAFTRVVEENSNDRKVTFRTVVEGRLRKLNPIVLEESYAIGREALINALTHSEGRNVEAEITYDRRQFRLRIRDDGRGINAKILEEGGRPDHFGLVGMRERAERINAQLKLWSAAGTGTEIELIVPDATAYQKVEDKTRGSWFRFR
ncbi:MAG TPA: histidine kinase, partial [Anaerolineales bacterium]|nr:histidine kinase [Anaerolineales bacterium]